MLGVVDFHLQWLRRERIKIKIPSFLVAFLEWRVAVRKNMMLTAQCDKIVGSKLTEMVEIYGIKSEIGVKYDKFNQLI